jgi:ribosomal protein S18 acetylase RimI-like enzyme
MSNWNVREFLLSDCESVKQFTDESIGENYFSVTELKTFAERSIKDGVNCSFLVTDQKEKIKGLRLSLPPGHWTHGKGRHISPELWNVDLNSAAYFQSLFLHPSTRGQGLGPLLSNKSLECFRSLNAKAVITHAWLESPENSSLRYLNKMGFTSLKQHPHYWINVNYKCTLDGFPCKCTAVEMIKYL